MNFASEAAENKVMGSAYYIRAFCYYWMARLWGDVPLCLTAFESDNQEGIFPFREAKATVLTQVELDLLEAQKLLTGTSGAANRPTIEAVNTLMTDYYLWMYKVEKDPSALVKARAACNLALGSKILLKDFSEIFSIKNKLNNEIIFAISMVKDEKEGGFQADWLVPVSYVTSEYVENPVKVGSHQQWSFITPAYKNLLASVASDQRKEATYSSFYDPVRKLEHQWMNKYAGLWENGSRSFCSDIIIYRYADVLLFDAEIKCEEGDLAVVFYTVFTVSMSCFSLNIV